MASIVLSQVKPFMNALDEKFKDNKILQAFEAKTHLPKSYAIVGALGFYMLLIIFNLGGMGQILCNFIGFVVPTYYSLRALRTETTTDDSELLVYWVVYAFFTVAEFWVNTILRWVPFYFLFKTLFLVYIAFPQFGGARFIYNRFIDPVAEKFIFKNQRNKFPSSTAPVTPARPTGNNVNNGNNGNNMNANNFTNTANNFTNNASSTANEFSETLQNLKNQAANATGFSGNAAF